MESIFDASSVDEFKEELVKGVRRLLVAGVAISSIYYIVNSFCDKKGIPNELAKEVIEQVVTEDNNSEESDWVLSSDNVIATVYNAVPSQCNSDYRHTASMFNLDLNDVLSHKIIAMERTFMSSLGLKYGDVIKIEGTDGYDGIWQVQDIMNKRFSGQKKIDILVPKNIKNGKWDNVKLYTLKDKSLTNDYKTDMKGSMPEPKKNKKKNK